MQVCARCGKPETSGQHMMKGVPPHPLRSLRLRTFGILLNYLTLTRYYNDQLIAEDSIAFIFYEELVAASFLSLRLLWPVICSYILGDKYS